MRRAFFSPSILNNKQLADQKKQADLKGPYAILGREDALGLKLGDSTAEDIVTMANRAKKLRETVRSMKDVVDVLFDLKYRGLSVQEVT